MHELAVAQSIMEKVLAVVESETPGRISAIHLRIGRLTDIAPDALHFGFAALTRDTILAETSLFIESVAIRGMCRSCRQEFTVEEYRFICPRCGAHSVDMIRGDELEIASIEIANAESS